MKNLEETVDLMLSNDPKDQLKAEYWQTKIRLDRLTEEIAIYDASITPFDLSADGSLSRFSEGTRKE